MSIETIIDDVLDKPQPFGAGLEPGQQGSIEWLMERVGLCTASRFKDVLDFQKTGKPGAKRLAYLWELTIEQLTGKPSQHFASTAMQHGTDQEPHARMAYEALGRGMVMETRFIRHPDVRGVGGSPDGLVGEDGLIEIKCPFNSAIHLECFLSGMPVEHMAQIQGLLWITGREWGDFVSYDPRMAAPLDIYVRRVDRDDEYIANLDREVKVFLGLVAERLGKLRAAIERRE